MDAALPRRQHHVPQPWCLVPHEKKEASSKNRISVVASSAEQSVRAVVFQTREQLLKQRIELVNALRSRFFEFGYGAPQGIHNFRRSADIPDDEKRSIPPLAREICRDLLSQFSAQTARINALT